MQLATQRRRKIWSVGGANSPAEGEGIPFSVYPAPVSNFLHVFKFHTLRSLHLGKDAIILLFQSRVSLFAYRFGKKGH